MWTSHAGNHLGYVSNPYNTYASIPMFCTYFNVSSVDALKLNAVFLVFKEGLTNYEISQIGS